MRTWTIQLILSSFLLCGCAHGGTDSTEATSESEPKVFGRPPRCPFTSLGPLEVQNAGGMSLSRVYRDLRTATRARGGDAFIRTQGTGRAFRGEVIKFTDPDCMY